MNSIELLYGRNNLVLDLPYDFHIISSRYIPGIQDETSALLAALRSPIGKPAIRDLVKPGQRAVIVHSDITRATPNDRILPVLLGELEEAGIYRQDITLLNGLGTHRFQSENELRGMLGDQIVDRYRCLQHDCRDEVQLSDLGLSLKGHPILINKDYMDADIRILTGFIEPHLFAGFSGGPKAVLPSISGLQTILANHGYEMMEHPSASFGETVGNPIWDEMLEAALKTDPTFLLNVTLNRDQQITAVFAGDLLAAHTAGCAYVRRTAMIGIDELFDIVLTTNSGYPLDQNLYQSVKGIKAAAQAVKPGGTIIMFAACEDGLPDHGRYMDLLLEAKTPQRMLEIAAEPGFSSLDRWQVHVQSSILLKNCVYIYSDGLTDDQILAAHFKPCRNVKELIAKLISQYGPGCTIAVIPEGPQAVPVLAV